MIGSTAKTGEPQMKQIFIGRSASIKDESAFERKLYLIRKRAEFENSKSNRKEKNCSIVEFLMPHGHLQRHAHRRPD